MLRAQVYLRGGQKNSGAFWFMVGTHNRDYFVEHKLNPKQVQELSSTIYKCEEPEGSLLCFDPDGFHGKAPCVENRRTIFLELQPEGAAFKKSHIYISSGDLTPAVLQNINYFVNGHLRDRYDQHGDDEYLRKETPLPLSYIPHLFWSALKKWAQTTALRLVPKSFRRSTDNYNKG
jgi:ectoine hydroxylase-related dioxygenase (phytanoyl-CoA dioxygenase family)